MSNNKIRKYCHMKHMKMVTMIMKMMSSEVS